MADLTGMMQAAAGGAGGGANYIEDVFSTYLYTGTGSAQTITNGIDLAGEGGLVWGKNRLTGYYHLLTDSNRGVTKQLYSSQTFAEGTDSTLIASLNSTGFTLGTGSGLNQSGNSYVSWTFRKQPKFFDIVTYTGTGSNRTIAHALGSVPGCIIVKHTNNTDSWQVYHRANTANPETDYLVLNTTAGTADSNTRWNDTQPTAAVFSLGTDPTVNDSGGTYVAYLFAHDAGGFGLSGEDNVVSCGSYTGNGTFAGLDVDLGYEAQFVIAKRTTASDAGANWVIADTMRNMNQLAPAEGARVLLANTDADESPQGYLATNSKGFHVNSDSATINQSGETYIYIAIRRGLMKVPELGTTVYNAITRTGTGAIAQVTGVGFPPDLVASGFRNFGGPPSFFDKLRGPLQYLPSSGTNAEATRAGSLTSFNQDGFSLGADAFNIINFNTGTFVDWNFRRASGFFDEVCYTGTGSALTVSHNLAAVPELIIVKSRSNTGDWGTYSSSVGISKALALNLTNGSFSEGGTYWNNTPPTSTVFSVATDTTVNGSGRTYVAYLFATCAGVSKVGSYTGTGTTQAINCGFTTGARFVLIKRTDSTGDWYVWDSARGIVAGNDPYLLLNSTAVEVTSTDYVDTTAAGFELTSTAPAAINASGGSYIFLAIS